MSAPLTMPTEAREPQGDDRAERETASAVHPDEVHAGVQAALLPAVDATACAVDVPALQRQRPVRGPSVGSVSGASLSAAQPFSERTIDAAGASGRPWPGPPYGPACREASAVGAPTVPAPGPSGIASLADVARLGSRAEHAKPGMPAAEGVAPLIAPSDGCPAEAGQSAVGTAAGIPTYGQGRCPMSLLAPFIRRGK